MRVRGVEHDTLCELQALTASTSGKSRCAGVDEGHCACGAARRADLSLRPPTRQVSLRPDSPIRDGAGIADEGLAFSNFGREDSLRVVIVGAGFGESP